MEQLHTQRLRKMLRHRALVAAHVDEIFVLKQALDPLWKMEEKRAKVSHLTPFERLEDPTDVLYPDGTAVYKRRDEVKSIPTNLLEAPPPLPELNLEFSWTVVKDPPNLAELVEQNGGALLTGAAGTGKTFKTRQVVAALKHKFHVRQVAYTHQAAKILGDAMTLLHFMREFPKGIPDPENSWIVLDEAPLCALDLYTYLIASHKFLGVRFLICGDWGQCQPIDDPWGHNYEKSQTCSFMHALCGGLRVELTECRRSDRGHFEQYVIFRDISSWADLEGGQEGAMARLQQRYPWRGELPDVCVVLSHKDRNRVAMKLNCLCRRKVEAAGLETTLLVTDPDLLVPKGPHEEMWLWPGALLTAKVRDAKGKLRNACGYQVVSVGDTVVVEAEGGGRLALSRRECCRDMRLACARTAAGIQGATLSGRLLLLDALSVFMDHRKVYVAASRVTKGEFFHVATKDQERMVKS